MSGEQDKKQRKRKKKSGAGLIAPSYARPAEGSDEDVQLRNQPQDVNGKKRKHSGPMQASSDQVGPLASCVCTAMV